MEYYWWTCCPSLAYREIEDTECYLVRIGFILFSWHHLNMLQMSLTQITVDFLNITAKCSPSILISKPKFHFLIHLPAFIWCFIPVILFSTECYELFNHVFQLSFLHSSWMLSSTWAGRLWPSRLACCKRSFCFRYLVRALGLWQYGWYMVTGAWEISQAYKVVQGSL